MKMNTRCFILWIRVSFNKSSLVLFLVISLTKNRDQLSLLVCRPLDLSSELSDCSNMKTLMSTQICITLPCRAVTIYIWKRTISLKNSDTIFIDKVLTQKGLDINLHYQKNTGLEVQKPRITSKIPSHTWFVFYVPLELKGQFLRFFQNTSIKEKKNIFNKVWVDREVMFSIVWNHGFEIILSFPQLLEVPLISWEFHSRFCNSYNQITRREMRACCRSVLSNSYDPMDCSLPGYSIHGIFQARIMEWIAISSSRGSSQSRDWTHVSCISCNGR